MINLIIHTSSVIHQNIRSVRRNVEVFVAYIESFINKPDLIFLSEIWIHDYEKYFYKIPGYKFHANCNNSHAAGGVAVFASEDLNSYMLADFNYDVWIANVRGNTYSKNHTTLKPHKAAFWQFTFHEMGIYDMPATIDFILKTTKFPKLHYIGHSQGTTCFWIMCSQRPEYNEKIISMQALAPAAFIKGCKSPLIDFLAFFRRELYVLFKLFGTHDFLPSNYFLRQFSEYICQDKSVVQDFCSQVMFVIAGFDKEQMNHTMLPVIFGHTPAGASTKQLLHFGQLKASGRFRQYDHGIFENLKKYGRISPPDYNLQNVTAKVALHYGANDWLTIPSDVEKLHQALPNVVGKFLVKFPEFNHLDFVWGIDARELVYEKVTKLMKLIEGGHL